MYLSMYNGYIYICMHVAQGILRAPRPLSGRPFPATQAPLRAAATRAHSRKLERTRTWFQSSIALGQLNIWELGPPQPQQNVL